jgi:hypothetical protein
MTVNYDVNDKQFQKIFKAYISSLFARRQPFLYFSKDSCDVVYTTIDPDVLVINRPTIDDIINKITFKSINIYEMLNLYLPLELLTTKYYCVNIREVMEVIRKYITKDEITKQLHLRNNSKFVQLKNRKLGGDDIIAEVPCVYAISSPEIRFIDDIINTLTGWLNNVDNHIKQIEFNMINKSGINFLDLSYSVIDPKTSCVGFKIPFIDGLSSVSIGEYANKKDNNVLKIKIGKSGNVVRCAYLYTDDEIELLSIQPSMFYYSKN